VDYVAQMLTAAQVPDAKAAAAGVMALETSLARAHWTNVENRDAVKTYNRVAVKDLAARFPGLDWAAWTAELGVANAPHLIVSQPSFFAALAKTVGSTPIDRWKAHLKFHAVDRFAPYLSGALVNTRFDFRGKTLQGIRRCSRGGAARSPTWIRRRRLLGQSTWRNTSRQPPKRMDSSSKTCARPSSRASTASNG
jgi:predicted metalloendopeptidase